MDAYIFIQNYYVFNVLQLKRSLLVQNRATQLLYFVAYILMHLTCVKTFMVIYTLNPLWPMAVTYLVFHRPSVARAVLQTALLFIQ